jgi:DNA mismatch repair protein MSH6
MTDPDYDETTLHIPRDVLNGTKKVNKKPVLTPFERQYWNIKKDHMKTVLFFKKGKFYEM